MVGGFGSSIEQELFPGFGIPQPPAQNTSQGLQQLQDGFSQPAAQPQYSPPNPDLQRQHMLAEMLRKQQPSGGAMGGGLGAGMGGGIV